MKRSWSVEFMPEAHKALRKLDREVARRIRTIDLALPNMFTSSFINLCMVNGRGVSSYGLVIGESYTRLSTKPKRSLFTLSVIAVPFTNDESDLRR